jgi:hypothetical protein
VTQSEPTAAASSKGRIGERRGTVVPRLRELHRARERISIFRSLCDRHARDRARGQRLARHDRAITQGEAEGGRVGPELAMADLRGRNENAAVTTREPTFSAGREYLEGRRCDADPEAPCMIALFGPVPECVVGADRDRGERPQLCAVVAVDSERGGRPVIEPCIEVCRKRFAIVVCDEDGRRGVCRRDRQRVRAGLAGLSRRSPSPRRRGNRRGARPRRASPSRSGSAISRQGGGGGVVRVRSCPARGARDFRPVRSPGQIALRRPSRRNVRAFVAQRSPSRNRRRLAGGFVGSARGNVRFDARAHSRTDEGEAGADRAE